MTLAFELGGVEGWAPEGRITVNLVPPARVLCDITDVDKYCEDGSVSVFGLCHTLEHIPSEHYVQFLKDLYRKLAPGGCVEVIQTDVSLLLAMVPSQISFRAARLPIFSPADRLRENPHHQHFNMWDGRTLVEDFKAVGYDIAHLFHAGSWEFNQMDELFPEESQKYHGVQIPNLGVLAYKRKI